MAITYRSVKGSQLTSNEVDANFLQLYNTDLLLLPLDGSRAMTGDLDMGSNDISSARTIVLSSGASSNGDKAIAIGGLGTGVYRDETSGSILKWLVNNSDVLWYGDSIGVVSKAAFKAESTVTFSALTASTLTYLDASKNVVSLTNASGVLSNNGAGVLSWAAALSNALTSAKIFVGNGSNLATAVDVSGDTTIDNAGVMTIGANKATYTKSYNGTQLAIVQSMKMFTGN